MGPVHRRWWLADSNDPCGSIAPTHKPPHPPAVAPIVSTYMLEHALKTNLIDLKLLDFVCVGVFFTGVGSCPVQVQFAAQFDSTFNLVVVFVVSFVCRFGKKLHRGKT